VTREKGGAEDEHEDEDAITNIRSPYLYVNINTMFKKHV
jgi:hypothetical protein